MLRRSRFHAFLFTAALVVAAPADAQTGSAGQRGPSRPGQPQIALPDLTITSAKATVACVNGTVTATIDATVKNGDTNGLADLSKIPFAIVMDVTWGAALGEGKLDTKPPVKTVNPQAGGPKQLKPGESWSGKMTITGIPKYRPGTAQPLPSSASYRFTVMADPLKAVTEVNENNNTFSTGASDPCYPK